MSQTSLRKEVDQLSEQRESPLDNQIYKEADENKVKAEKLLESMQEAYFDVNCSLLKVASMVAAAVFEALGVGVLLCLPAALAFLFTEEKQYSYYNLFVVKYGLKDDAKLPMNSVMEFVRFSILSASIYGCHVLLQAAARVVPLLIRRSWHVLKTPMPNSMRIFLAGLRSCRSYIAFAALLLCTLALFDIFVYSGSALASLAIDKKLFPASSGYTSFGRFTERLLIALSMLSLMILICQWLMHIVTQEYRKAALAIRIDESNRKYQIIAQLVRLTALGSIDARRSLKREKLRNQLQASRDELIKLTPDTAGLHLKNQEAARTLARKLWTAICPFGRDYIVAEDLRAFFSDPVEAKESFDAFDEGETGLINATVFEASMVGFQQQRANLQASVQMSDQTLGILSHVLSALIGLIWISAVVWLYNQDSYPLFLSLGTFIFTFSFLFKDTAKLIFDCFVFILAVHPFDIGDSIIVDKQAYKVISIGLFSTKLERESDGTYAHFPNGQLAGKSIFNRERSVIVTDALMIMLPSSPSLSGIAALQARLKAYLEANFAAFTGKVAIVPLEIDPSADKMSVRVECKFSDAQVTEREARVLRKEKINAKLQEFLQLL